MNLTLTCIKIQEKVLRLLNFPIFLHVTISSLPQLLAISLANIYIYIYIYIYIHVYNKADHTGGNFGRLWHGKVIVFEISCYIHMQHAQLIVLPLCEQQNLLWFMYGPLNIRTCMSLKEQSSRKHMYIAEHLGHATVYHSQYSGLLGRAWASPTLVKRRPPRSIYVYIVRHSVNAPAF